jgi:F-type H+-transporting ATPase subunit b
MKKSLLAALVLVPALALAQETHKPAKHAVAAPAATATHVEAAKRANENDKKDEKAKEVEEEGPAPFKLWDSQILLNPQVPYGAMLINFGLLLLLFYRFGKAPLAQGLKTRKVSIAAAIENAQKILREARQRSKRYRAKLEKVSGEAEQHKQNQISVGNAEADQIQRGATEKAARLTRDVEFLLEQEKKQSQLDLVRETVEKAAKEAEALLRANVSTADQERLADEFLTKLAADYAKGLPT